MAQRLDNSPKVTELEMARVKNLPEQPNQYAKLPFIEVYLKALLYNILDVRLSLKV